MYTSAKHKLDTETTTTHLQQIEGLDLPTDRNARQLLCPPPKQVASSADTLKTEGPKISVQVQRINDGLDFQPNTSIGASCPLISVNTDQEVVYVSGNSFCISRLGARKDECVPRNSFVRCSLSSKSNNSTKSDQTLDNNNCSVEQILTLKTSKINMLLAVQKIDRRYKDLVTVEGLDDQGPFISHHLYCIDLEEKVSFNAFFQAPSTQIAENSCTSRMRCVGSHIISMDRRALVLMKSPKVEQPRFILYSVDLRAKDNMISRMTQSRNTDALSLVASNFGDFCVVLCKDTLYEIQVDPSKVELSQFEARKHLAPGEQFISAQFLKDTIRLVVATNQLRILIFDGRILLSKSVLSIPVKNVPSYIDVSVTTNQEEPIQVTYEKLAQPKSIDTSKDQLTVLFSDNKIALFRLEDKNIFNFQSRYKIPGATQTSTPQVISQRFVNGDMFITLRRSAGIQVWRINLKRSGQENHQICLGMSGMNYFGETPLQVVGWDLVKALSMLFIMSKDKCLRVWDMDYGLVYSKQFFETPTGMAIHPFGFQGVISFKEFTRFYSIKQGTLDLIHTYKVRNISAVKYSANGNTLVMAEGPLINVLNPYTFQTISSFSNNSIPAPNTLITKEELLMYCNDGVIAVIRYLGNPPKSENDEGAAGRKLIERKAVCGDFSPQYLLYSDNGLRLKLYTYEYIRDSEIAIPLLAGQRITFIKILQLFGLVLFGTSEGYILETLWPITDQRPAFYRYRAATSPILALQPLETFRQIFVLTADCMILTLQVTQFIDGNATAGLYVFNNVRTERMYEYDVQDHRENKSEKRSLLSREYLMSKFRTTTSKIIYERNSQLDELESRANSLLGEVDTSKKDNTAMVKSLLDGYRARREKEQTEEIQNFKKINQASKQREEAGFHRLKDLDAGFLKAKEQQIEKYEKKLLEIVKRSHQLVALKNKQASRLEQIEADLRVKNEQVLQSIRQDKVQKYSVLVEKFQKLMEAVQRDKTIMQHIEKDTEEEEREFLKVIERQYHLELESENSRMDSLVSRIAKHEKDIVNFNTRAKYLENLIDDTDKQIDILTKSEQKYNKKSNQILAQLRMKESVINQKEEEIKRLLMQNAEVKSFKNVHEFLLSEFRAEEEPNEIRAQNLQGQIKIMNEDLLQEIDRRNEFIQQIQKLKKLITHRKQERENKEKLRAGLKASIDDVAHKITSVLRNTNPEEWNTAIKKLYEQKFTQNKLLIDRVLQSLAEAQIDTFEPTEEQVKMMNEIEGVLRKKEELHTRILREGKLSSDQERYKEDIFKKYQKQNTELVKEYNQLTKERKTLMEQNAQLLKLAKELLQEPEPKLHMQRSLSNQVIKRELKLTPFQRYTEQQMSSARKGNSTERQTTTARTHGNSSTTFLKSLIKDVDTSKMKGIDSAAEIIRAKVKSFVNPELPRIKLPGSTHLNPNSKLSNNNLVDVFNKVTLESREIRTKSQLVKSQTRPDLGKKIV